MSDAKLNGVKRFLAGPIEEPDRRLGRLAVSKGLLTEDRLEEALAEQERLRAAGDHLQLGQILLGRGWLASAPFLELLRLQKPGIVACTRCGWSCDASQHPEGIRLLCLGCGDILKESQETRAPAAPPDDKRLGKYRILREVARGGMGIVYEAEDPALKRRVALKILPEGDAAPEAVSRLHREAAIAAQLRHPNIVTVHEVGMVTRPTGPSTHFIAMDFIEGRTLAEILSEKKTERAELLRILEEVSRAAAHAHARRIVHRDLKPANVVVDGTGRAMLMDFGLARAESFATRITRSGVVMGTPQYMAPEQLEGRAEEIEIRTDVYALGAILFEILAGRPPFDAETFAEACKKILMDEPALPAGAEADLRVICLKALDKDRRRRYASALEFAEDLGRYRRGEPILARAASLLTRIGRKAARRKAVLWTAAGGLALTTLVAGVLIGLARRQRAETLRQLQGRVDVAMRAALEFRRSGDLDRMRGFLKEVDQACAEGREKLPDRPEPHALLGRMHRALMDYDAALEEQERALAKDPRHALARYERVILNSRLYRRRVDGLVERAWRAAGERLINQRSRDVRPADLEEVSREELARSDPTAMNLRRRIESDLRALDGIAAGGIGPGESFCARGLFAWVTGDADSGRNLLEQALAHAPLLEEAYEALATLELDLGRFEETVAVWSRAIETDKGYLPFLEGRGYARGQWGYELARQGEDPAKIYEASIADFELALSKGAGEEAMRNRAVAHYLLGAHVWGLQADPQPRFQTAIDDLGRAIEMKEDAALSWMWRGVVRAMLGLYRLQKLGNPTKLCEEALADLTESVKRNPDGDEAYMWRALARAPLAIYMTILGGDPGPIFRDSLADFDEALRRNPGRADTWMWRGVSHGVWALHEANTGKDPKGSWERALRDLDVALAKKPGAADALEFRGSFRSRLGLITMDRGGDPRDYFREAMDDFNALVAARKPKPIHWSSRGEVRLWWGIYESEQGRDPVEHYAAAMSDLNAALDRERQPAAILIRRGEAWVRGAERLEGRGQDGSAECEKALEDLKKAFGWNPFLGENALWQGRAKALLAARRGDAKMRDDAIFNLSWYLNGNASDTRALRFRAEAYRAKGEWRPALQDYEKAVKLNSGLGEKLREAMAECRGKLGKR